MKGMRLANVTFDFPKEWTHTRFVSIAICNNFQIHDKLIKEIEEKMFQYHQIQQQQHQKKMVIMMGYKYEKNAETLDKNREQNMLIQFLENLFDMWDPDRDGYLHGEKLADYILSLGLAKNKEFIFRLMSITLKRPFTSIA